MKIIDDCNGETTGVVGDGVVGDGDFLDTDEFGMEEECRMSVYKSKIFGTIEKKFGFWRNKNFRNLDGKVKWLKEKEDSGEREKMFGRLLNWSFYDVDEFYGGDRDRGGTLGVNRVGNSLMKSKVL